MNSPLLTVLPFIGVVLKVVLLIIGLVLLALRASGRAKKPGIAGVVVILAVTVLRTASTPLIAASASGDEYILLFQASNLVFTLLELAGLAALVGAVIVGSVDAAQQRGGPQQAPAQPLAGGRPPMGGQPPTDGQPPYGAEPPVSGGWGPSSSGPPPR